jgi:hypothetical protein
MEGRLKRFLFDSAKLNGISHLLLKNENAENSEETEIVSVVVKEGSSSSSKSKKSQQQMLPFPLSPQLLYLLPTVRHFHSCLTLQMKCASCGLRKDPRQEYYRDFSLDFDFDASAVDAAYGDSGSSNPNPSVMSNVSGSRGSYGTLGQRQRVFKVEDLLRQFFAAENRDLHCESCMTKGAQATVTAQISLLPNVLVLHLKRFKYNSSSNSFQKVGNRVSFQKYLDLRPFCSEDCQANPHAVDDAADGVAGGGSGLGLDKPCSVAFDLGEEVRRVRRQLDMSLSPGTEEVEEEEEEGNAHSPLHIDGDDDGGAEDEFALDQEHDTFPSKNDQVDTPSRSNNSNSKEYFDDVIVAQGTPSSPPRNPLTSPGGVGVSGGSSRKRMNESIGDGTALDSLGTRYTLSAVVRHLGSDAFAGHYICDTLVPSSSVASESVSKTQGSMTSNQWRRCNDSHVAPVLESEVFAEQESPYILFYTRCR